jgi:NAD(P)-dependent dehydrogenase (short-subunit alcohol dehydrogenase family)
MAHYRGTVLSTRSAEDTFDYLAEFSNAAEWDPGVAGSRRLDDGPVGPDSSFRLEVRVGPRAVPLTYRVVAYERPHRVVLLGETGTLRSEDTVTVVSDGRGRSILTYDAELELLGPLAPLTPLLALPFRRIGDRGLAGLRRVLSAPLEPSPGPSPVARVVDELLEATVAGSFSAIGPAVRRPLAGWAEPPSMEGKVVLVTGATSGLGRSAAVGMAGLGAAVRIVARDAGRGAAAAGLITGAVPGTDVEVLLGDMGEPDQVRVVAERFLADNDRLDVLVHNAGALSGEYRVNSRGTEVTVASQLVGPFLLSGLLLPSLSRARPARILQVSSGGMYTQRFDLAALDAGPAGYDGTVTYARVKRAQLVLMHEWARRLDGDGVAVHAMHPGWADTPGLRAALPGFARVTGPLLRSPEDGADTLVWLAAAPEAAVTTALFWLDRRPRWENKVPWTRLPAAEFVRAGSELWSWCAQRAGWDGLPPGR